MNSGGPPRLSDMSNVFKPPSLSKIRLRLCTFRRARTPRTGRPVLRELSRLGKTDLLVETTAAVVVALDLDGQVFQALPREFRQPGVGRPGSSRRSLFMSSRILRASRSFPMNGIQR